MRSDKVWIGFDRARFAPEHVGAQFSVHRTSLMSKAGTGYDRRLRLKTLTVSDPRSADTRILYTARVMSGRKPCRQHAPQTDRPVLVSREQITQLCDICRVGRFCWDAVTAKPSSWKSHHANQATCHSRRSERRAETIGVNGVEETKRVCSADLTRL